MVAAGVEAVSTDQDVSATRALAAKYAAVYPGGVRFSVGGALPASFNSVLASPAGATVTMRSATFQWWGNPAGNIAPGDIIQFVTVRSGGHCANNANAKNVAVTFGGTTVLSLDLTASAANSWWFELVFGVQTVSAVTVAGFAAQGPGTPTFVLPAVATVTGVSMLAPITIATVVTQTAAADVTQDNFLVDAVSPS